jgi:hypothetical protein
VIAGNLFKPIVAQTVKPGVTDVSDGKPVVPEERHNQSRTHTGVLGLTVGGFEYGGIRLRDYVPEKARGLSVTIALAQGKQPGIGDRLSHFRCNEGYGDATCHLSRVVAPHSVSQNG